MSTHTTGATARAPQGGANPKNRIRGSRRAPPTNACPKGKTLNPHGAPRKGMSIAETIRSLQALTPGELRDVLRKAGASGRSGLERSLAEYPQGMPMRMITHLSAIVSAANEPQPGILSYLAERDEGKVPDRLEHGGKVIVEVEYVNPRASQG